MAVSDLELFERMVADLRSRGMAEENIAHLREIWPDFWLEPCPFCLLSARPGRVYRLREPVGLQQMQCDTCGEVIRLERR